MNQYYNIIQKKCEPDRAATTKIEVKKLEPVKTPPPEEVKEKLEMSVSNVNNTTFDKKK